MVHLTSTVGDGIMSRFSADLRRVLGVALEAGRSALFEIDADEVPASLRRVRAHSGGRLPPPLAVSLLVALDERDELREAAVAFLPDDGADPAAAAFLRRETGWWETVAAAAVEARAAELELELKRAAEKADSASSRLAEAGRRVKQARAERDAERDRRRRDAAATPRRPDGDGEVKELKDHLASMRVEVDDERRERIEAQAMIARLRARLRGRSRREDTAVAAGEPSSLGGDPLAVARTLDLMAASARRRARPTIDDRHDRAFDGLSLPKGVRPDRAAAVEWLGSVDRPFTVLVDAYNVLYGMDAGSFTTRVARERLIQDLTRFRRMAGAVRVVAVFDSSLPGARDTRVAAGGVEIRFAEEDYLADDEIVGLVGAGRDPVVVVTSDRDLQARSEARGALTLFSEALTDWMAG